MTSLLLHNGHIWTMNPERPVAEAVGIVNDRIVAVGTLDRVRQALGNNPDELDLQGRTAFPGFYDAHCHPMGVGFASLDLDVSADCVSSIADIRDLVRQRVAETPAGTWIVGRGYDQALLANQRHPMRDDLDDIAPDHPVILRRSCHHIMAVNSQALALGGVSASTPAPDDGTIDRGDDGEPTGVLREAAQDPVLAAMGGPTEDDIAEAIRASGQIFRKFGVTSVAEAGIRTADEMHAYQRCHDNGDLAVRTYLMMIIDDTLDELASLGIRTGFGDDWLRIGNAKLFSDGSIGGRTARMSGPYEGEPNNRGLFMIPPEAIHERILRAHRAGFQIGIHAIGDEAISTVLDGYEMALREQPVEDPRFRVEHCSIIDPAIIDRIERLGAVPIPGTTFLYDMRPVYLQNLGKDRVRYAYAMNTFANRGIVAAASSDSPVSSANPMVGVQMMVTRKDRNGDEIWPEERIPLDDAIRAYTWNSAYASFDETSKGSLEPGKLADVTVMETDLRDVDPMRLKDVRCDVTIADGRVVYERA